MELTFSKALEILRSRPADCGGGSLQTVGGGTDTSKLSYWPSQRHFAAFDADFHDGVDEDSRKAHTGPHILVSFYRETRLRYLISCLEHAFWCPYGSGLTIKDAWSDPQDLCFCRCRWASLAISPIFRAPCGSTD